MMLHVRNRTYVMRVWKLPRLTDTAAWCNGDIMWLVPGSSSKSAPGYLLECRTRGNQPTTKKFFFWGHTYDLSQRGVIHASMFRCQRYIILYDIIRYQIWSVSYAPVKKLFKFGNYRALACTSGTDNPSTFSIFKAGLHPAIPRD